MLHTPSASAPLCRRVANLLSADVALSPRELEERAKAIVSSLLEPTSAMITAGETGVVTAATWRAMVRAAIEES